MAAIRERIDAGLIPMHAVTASADEWDEYEWKFSRSIEAYARDATFIKVKAGSE